MGPGLIIVSNRLPVSVKKTDGKLEFFDSVGGLSTGLASYANDKRNKWIGWPGLASDELNEKERQQIAEELLKRNCYPVFLTKKQVDGFYNGYSNRLVWPLFHDVTLSESALELEDAYWKSYKQVNAIFAESVLALSADESSVWVHDYQLMLLPALLRAQRSSGKIGFFLHIPFPEFIHFSRLKHAAALTAGLLGADLVGFHIMPYATNFIDAVQHFDLGVGQSRKVVMPDRVVRVTDFPIGIDYTKWRRANKLWLVRKEIIRLKLKYRRKKLILTVDRLDPTKGLVERVAAYRTLLRENPGFLGKVELVMIAVPSRTDIEEYKTLKDRLEKLITETNEEFGTGRWLPIDYQYTSLPFERLRALYQRADIAFIVPLKDGMNLVAKEYLASKPRHNGVLVLSKTAGAAEELKDAVVVDPAQPETVVEGLKTAIKMSRHDSKQRTGRMQQQISDANIHTWATGFMRSLRQASRFSQPTTTSNLTTSREEYMATAYRQALKRLLILDYDGVLAGFTGKPGDAKPSRRALHILEHLAADPLNTIVLATGRPPADVDAWFDGLNINFAAEHGGFIRLAGSKTWKATATHATKHWQQRLLPILERYVERTPGAFIENKATSLVWHYRLAKPYYAQKNLVILKKALRPLVAALGLNVRQGHMTLEIRAADIDKGTIARRWLKQRPDFVLAIGDDYTDEDVFESLSPGSFGIKVGRGRTAARYRLPSVDSVLKTLDRLSKVS